MSVDLGGGVLLVRRTEWGARPPRSRQPLVPTFGTTVHWEGTHLGPSTHDRCAGRVRSIQNYHMDTRGWQDIAYSGLVCPHGYVFEGRWVGVRSAANGTSAGNSTAYTLCYLGGAGDAFTQEARVALRVALSYLDRVGGAGSGRNCHRDWKPTQCPGDEICAWVKSLPDALPPSAPAPPQPGTPPPYPGTFRLTTPHMRGEGVKVWQRRFRQVGYGLVVDGVWGPATNHVVIHFQTTHRLRPDGIAGPATWHVLWFAP